MLIPYAILFLVIWGLAALLALFVHSVLVGRQRRRCPPGTCQHCGYDLRATPGQCPECGAPAAALPAIISRRRLRRIVVLVLLVPCLVNAAWPYLFVRPKLLREARRDIFTLPTVVPASTLPSGQMVRVGDVLQVRESLRVRPVSDSHHNVYLAYGGTTYVNVNNRVFGHGGGHCAAVWIPPENIAEMSESQFIAELLRRGYREFPR